MKSRHLILPALLFSFSASMPNERGQAALVQHATNIVGAARSFGVSPRLLASIVYAENSLNVKPGEYVLDQVFAFSGYNASIGVAQIKIETARWIHRELENSSGMLFDPVRAAILQKEATGDMVEQLDNPRVNLLYAAAYISMIMQVWQNLLRLPPYKESMAGIVASIYSLGLSRSDGSLRLPHAGARMNQFGQVSQAFYDSFEMTNELPR